MLRTILMAAALALAVPLQAQEKKEPAKKPTAQQKGEERKKFMSECLKA